MPELPDVIVYIESLESLILGRRLDAVRLISPFLLRTAMPSITLAEGRKVMGLRRMGKRVVIALEGGYFLVLHLMIAGRLRWLPSEGSPPRKPPGRPPGRSALAVFCFSGDEGPAGRLVFAEAGTRKRAALHFVEGESALAALDPGGMEVLECSLADFSARLTAENHTLKRALTDPRAFSGIGNAYSDEILHRAKLSPIALTQKLSAEEIARLWRAVREVLTEWTTRLRVQAAGKFPEGVTAFRPEMAVHGRFRQPCPVCGSPVQRIVYAENETNYCARCQTGGTVLADRALSRLLKKSWPRSIDDV